MIFKKITFLFFVLAIVACNSLSKKDNVMNKAMDTIIDFSTVDVSPSFKICEKLLDEAKTNCFRSNIRQKFTGALSDQSLKTKSLLNETILVTLAIDKNGNMSLKSIESSDAVTDEFPDLEKSILQVVKSMPKLYPATKRGIPVATEYKLPIQIKSSE